jgi:NADH-quinone oxidoreductase subunit A
LCRYDADGRFARLLAAAVASRETAREDAQRVLDDYLPLLIYALMAVAIPMTMITLSFVAPRQPSKRTKARTLPFESGVSRGELPQGRFTVSFYLTAMLFIVFDIEIVFLYPVAVVLEQVGWFAVAEFGFFIAILVLAYVYIWRKGALEWR